MTRNKRASPYLDKYAEAGRAAIVREIDPSLAAAQGAATFEEALYVLALHARLMIGAHQSALSYVPDGNFTTAIHTHSFSKKYEKYNSYDVMPTGKGIWGVIVEQKVPIRLTQEELVSHPRWKNFGDLKDARGLEHPAMVGWLAIPILRRDGGFVGVLQLSDKFEGEFTEEDQELLGRLGSVISPTFDLQYVLGERKRAEETLRINEERFRNLFEEAPVAYHEIDTEGIVRRVNRAECTLLGYEAEEILGKFAWDLIAPEEREEAQEAFRRRIRGEQPLEVVHRTYIRRDGAPLTLELHQSLTRDAEGAVTGMRTTRLDITKRKRAEEELRKTEERYRLILNLVTDGFWDWELGTDNEYLSPGFKKLFGYEDHEIPNRASSWQSIIHPDDLQLALKTYKEHTEEGKPYNIRVRYFHKNGSLVWVTCRGVALKNEKGNYMRMVGTHTDITKLKQSEEAIQQLKEDLERRAAQLETTNHELEAFTYSVSHDLRAPLCHMDGFSQLLLEEHSAELSEQARRFAARIREGSRQMGQLIDDLLNLSRLGRRELSLQVTGLNSLVKEAVAKLDRETAGRRIEWKIRPLPFVECDPALMKQVFANLLSNAVKYSRPREQAVIEVGALNQDASTAIFVRDNGVGFSMRYADKLFGVFQRLHRAEDFEGTGVGLASVQRIVHKHGGCVWAEGELDKGATFYFTLGTQEKPGDLTQTASGRLSHVKG